jgi:hypothetical protein
LLLSEPFVEEPRDTGYVLMQAKVIRKRKESYLRIRWCPYYVTTRRIVVDCLIVKAPLNHKRC